MKVVPKTGTTEELTEALSLILENMSDYEQLFRASTTAVFINRMIELRNLFGEGSTADNMKNILAESPDEYVVSIFVSAQIGQVVQKLSLMSQGIVPKDGSTIDVARDRGVI